VRQASMIQASAMCLLPCLADRTPAVGRTETEAPLGQSRGFYDVSA
jgi:hypothetical protein